jgi:hypothetical protein
MSKFEELEREIIDICEVNDIDYKYRYDAVLGRYILLLEKGDKNFSIIVYESVLVIKPFAVVIDEVKYLINNFIKEI